MALKGKKKAEQLSDKPASKKEQKVLDKYREWYYKAKNGVEPDVIRVTDDQLKKLGVSEGFLYKGAKLLKMGAENA